MDFASSGLVVSNAKIRMMSSSQSHDQKGSGNRDSCSSDMDDKLSMLVHGDNRPWSTYDLIGKVWSKGDVSCGGDQCPGM